MKILLAIALVVLPAAGQAAPLDETERRMIEWIDAHSEDAIALLEETVNISSGSNNHEGVREVGVVMRRELDDLGLDTEWIDQSHVQRAGHLFGYKHGTRGKKFLLIGHLDTVFEADEGFEGFRREGNTAYGPGVDDMKSGNVIIVYALAALAEAGVLDDIQVTVAYTGDEEKTGKPVSVSRKELIDAGRWADYSLGFEGAVTFDDTDWGTIARRSSGSWKLEVSGRQAHSSGIFSEKTGAGAVFEAARILNSFYEELSDEEYLTFNVGTILGGTDITYDGAQSRGTVFGKRNVVPRKVIVNGGVRAISLEQLERTKAAMQDIVARNLPRTNASITFRDSYPPMPPTEGNRAMYRVLSDVNDALGRGPMQILDPSRRGAADVSFVSPYSDSLAGLGGLGTGAHSPNETLDLESMPLAIKRAALLMYRLSRAN